MGSFSETFNNPGKLSLMNSPEVWASATLRA